jgi:AraC-like DNA-binding protein
MTAHANLLTERVGVAAGQPITMPAQDLRVFLKGLNDLGHDPDALVTAAGLRDLDLANSDSRVSCEACGKVLACAQRQRFTPNLGLELARVTPLGAWPLLDYLVLTSDTIANGAHQLVRYLRLTGNPVAMTIHEESDPVRIEMTTTVQPFAMEFLAALIHLHFRTETEGRFTCLSVNFRHQLDDRDDFERKLGPPVNTNAVWDGLEIAQACWHLPLRRRDPILRQMLERQANNILEQLPQHSGLAADVQRVLVSRIAGGDIRTQAVARVLNVSARTLQRRLAEEGVTYQALVDRARKDAASRYLGNANLAIGEVAYLVGFSEPAPFHRAFKRWFGVTPERFRQQQRGISIS